MSSITVVYLYTWRVGRCFLVIAHSGVYVETAIDFISSRMSEVLLMTSKLDTRMGTPSSLQSLHAESSYCPKGLCSRYADIQASAPERSIERLYALPS